MIGLCSSNCEGVRRCVCYLQIAGEVWCDVVRQCVQDTDRTRDSGACNLRSHNFATIDCAALALFGMRCYLVFQLLYI